jgi:hypothetical protein
MRWLQFRMMRVRHDEVDKAHEKTLQWVFHERCAQEQEQPWPDLVEWLESRSSCYWVNGKAGSGKSTLMKYIVDHPGTHSALLKWAGTDILVLGHKIFSRGVSMGLISIAGFAQVLIGLGAGRSPSSSLCSPSAQTLLSRAQSRSSTLSSAPIMHFLTRPSCRSPLPKFRRRCSGCPVPST